MALSWTLVLASLLAAPATRAAAAGAADAPRGKGGNPFPQVDKNHVRKTSGDYIGAFRRIRWHYDFETAAALARDTRRPMFVIFCRAGSITDPSSGKPKCAS